jgi:hypothetical protein
VLDFSYSLMQMQRYYILRRWNLLLWQKLLIPKRQKKAITIMKPIKFIYGNVSLCIDIAQNKKVPTQVQKPFALTLEFAQNSRQSPNKVDIPLLKQVAKSFVPDTNKRYDVAAA